MAKPISSPPGGSRQSAEEKFERATKAAAESVDTERVATRKKIARLKALRLAQDAAEGEAGAETGTKKPSKPRGKAARK